MSEIQRGESTGRAKLPAFTRPKECSHADQPAMVRKDTRRNLAPHITKPMRFVSLHHHSTYSYLDGFQLPDAHARRIAELNGSALALTEHGNMMSHAKFEAAVRKERNSSGEPNPAHGIKPIFGVEFYCGEIDEAHRAQKKNHLTVLARDQKGYQNLLRLVSRSWAEGYYYEPTVSGSMLLDHSEGLVVLSGCQGSLLFTSLVGGKHIDNGSASYERGRSVASRFKRRLGDRYFLEVQAFPELTLTKWANPMIARISRELKIPMVATVDCHYTLPTEKEIQQVLHAIRSGGRETPEQKAASWGYAADLCPPTTDRSIMRKLIATGLTRQEAINAILMSEEIAQDCNVELPKLPMVRYPTKDGVKLFRQWIEDGWRYRRCDSLPPAEQRRYRERLQYESSIIEGKDFVDYFLVVSSAVKFAKDKGIGVGPARGSAAASLVCWLLRITEVNPMDFPHLVFERFIDVTREDLPDIDLDFESARRGEVVDYLVNRYGRDCVSNIGTFTTYKSKLALRDTARVYRIPEYEVDQIKNVLLERSSGDLRASATIEDTIEQFDQAREVIERHPNLYTATKLEGNVKTFGVHAAGIVVSNGTITEVTPVLNRVVKGKMRQVVGVDKYDAEYLGMLKLDFLGLSAIDLLVECCREIGKPASFMYEIPLDDPATLKGFKDNDVIGIFQYEGRAMRQVNASVKPDDFNEVCHITALARPGPLHNGAVSDYIAIKNGRKRPEVRHPALAEITGFTQFQVVYQEQILRIVREIGNFEWTHAAYIRKIISRKLGDAEFNRQWERFWKGVQELHPDMTEENARAIWGLCTTAGSYAFNAAHSISYGLIAWLTMWFKQNHPEIFFTASLKRVAGKSGAGSGNTKASVTSSAKLDPQSITMRDAVRHGFTILPPTLRRSQATWRRLPHSRLLSGFEQIPDIGEKKAQLILEWKRENQGRHLQWNNLLEVKGIGLKTIEKMLTFVHSEDPFGIYSLEKTLRKVKSDLPDLNIPPPTHEAIDVPYESGRDEEIVWIGVAVNRNLRDIFEANRARTGEALNSAEVKDPHLNEWMLIAGYDGTDLLSLRVTRWKYPHMKKKLWGIALNKDVLVVRGVKRGYRTAREIQVNDMWVLDPE